MPCADKIQYSTQVEAERAVRKMKRQPIKGHGLRRLNAYQCPECGWYHVGRYAPRMKPTTAEPKPATPRQQRRAAKQKAAEQARQRMFEDWRDTLRHVARMVDDELARMQAARTPKH